MFKYFSGEHEVDLSETDNSIPDIFGVKLPLDENIDKLQAKMEFAKRTGKWPILYKKPTEHDYIISPGFESNMLFLDYMDDNLFKLYSEIYNLNTDQLRSIYWSPVISKVISKYQTRPTLAYYSSNLESNQFINKILNSEELDKELRYLSGHDFEKVIFDFLRDYNIEVELNIRILGSEIDLKLCSYDDFGKKQYTIIECKQKGQSGKKVQANVVHKMYSLQTMLREDNLNVKNSILVSTTGYSREAQKLVVNRKMDFDLFSFRTLIEWLSNNNLIQEQVFVPLLKTGTLNSNFEITLPSALIRHLGSEKIVLNGFMNRIEIWNKEAYNNLIKNEFSLDYSEIFQTHMNSILKV